MGASTPVPLDTATVIVVNWNLPRDTLRAARALVEDGVPPQRIVVVDNGSEDWSWELLRGELGGCYLVRLDVNVGFARANNIAARILPGEAYLLVNNDAFVHLPGSVGRLLEALGRPRVAVAVPRLLNEDLSLQPSVAPFTTPSVALVRASGLSRLIPSRWQPRWSTHWDHDEPRAVQTALGAVMAVRGEAWRRLDGFRETSFFYAEDLDLCWRASELGWLTWFEPSAEFVHRGAVSSGSLWDEETRNERKGRAEAAMIRDHLPPARAALTLGLLRGGLGARALAYRLTGREERLAACRGYLRGTRQAGDAVRPAAPEVTVRPPVVAR